MNDETTTDCVGYALDVRPVRGDHCVAAAEGTLGDRQIDRVVEARSGGEGADGTSLVLGERLDRAAAETWARATG